MSQFYVTQMGGSGPLPPTVPTQFTVDLDDSGSPFGTVIPVDNNVNILGNPPTQDTQGIVTQQQPGNGPQDTIFLRYITGTTFTIGGPSFIIKTVSIPEDNAFTITAIVAAFDSSTGDNFGGRLLAVGSNIGGIVEITAVIENISSGTGVLADCHINVVAQLNAVAIEVTGVAGETIQWKAIIPTISII